MTPICFTPFHLLLKTGFRVFASHLLLAGLIGCGGGSSNATGGMPDVPPVTPFVPAVNPGAYIGTVNNKDWITILRPTAPAIDGVTKYLALHYHATDPDNESVSGRIAGNKTATLNTVSVAAKTKKGAGKQDKGALSVARCRTELIEDLSELPKTDKFPFKLVGENEEWEMVLAAPSEDEKIRWIDYFNKKKT
jgi:hypothetical protein